MSEPTDSSILHSPVKTSPVDSDHSFIEEEDLGMDISEYLPKPCKIMKCVKITKEARDSETDLDDQKRKQNLERKLLRERETESKKIYSLEKEQLRLELKRAKLEEKARRQSENLEKTRQRLERQKQILEERNVRKLQKEQQESEKKTSVETLKRKQLKEQEFFKSFFTSVKKTTTSPAKPSHCLFSLPDPNMSVTVRPLSAEDILIFDRLLRAGDESVTYRPERIRFSVERDQKGYKLLMFHDNNRPSYYGTWRKRSEVLGGRRPLRRDEGLFDYEAESDWDEELSGDNVTGTDEEGDEEEDEAENEGFLVPEGYLSEDEGGGGCGTSFGQSNALNPVVIGPLWEGQGDSAYLEKYKVVDVPPLPENSETKQTFSKKPVPEEAMTHIIKLCHGNPHGLQSLITEFQLFWIKHTGIILDSLKIRLLASNPGEVNSMSPISKRQLELKMTQISTYERRDEKKKWYVRDDVLKLYGMEDIPAVNKWEYLTIKNDS